MAVLIIIVVNYFAPQPQHCQVCAPLGDGCDGCYLISRAPRRWDQREGWHAEILPGRGRMDSWHSLLNKITLVRMIECMIGAFAQAEKSLAGRTMTLVALRLALQVSFGSIDVCFLFTRTGSCILSDCI